jgi:Mrp family chromosome partitioning ATPase
VKESPIVGGFNRADTRDLVPPAGTPEGGSFSPSATARGERWAVLPELLPTISHRGRFEKLRTPSGSFADEAYEMLRTQILLLMLRGGYRTLAVTSPTPGAGTSTVAANVAAALSREFDFTTILIDANLRNPSLRRMLDLPPGPGLADYLAGNAKPEEVLIKMEGRRLLMLPGSEPIQGGAELLRSPMMVELVRGLSDAHRDRLVVFDLPPVLDGSDMLAFSPLVDAVLLVIEEGVTTQEELERAHEILSEAHVLGIVPCKSREAARLRSGRSRKRAGSSRRAHETRTLEARVDETFSRAEETPTEPVRTTNSRLKRRSRKVLLFVIPLTAFAGLCMLAFAEGWQLSDRVVELWSEISDRVAELLTKLGR